MSRWARTDRLAGLPGVPDGLDAWREDLVVDTPDGPRVQGSRGGHAPIRRLVLRTSDPRPVGLPHGRIREPLDAGERSRSGDRSDELAHALARAGLVELVCEPAEGVRLACGQWQRWRRTDTGAALAAAHAAPLHADHPIDAAARQMADSSVVDRVDATAHWESAAQDAVSELTRLADRARRRAAGGELAGMPRSVAARRLLDDTHALDAGAAVGPRVQVVLAALGRSAGEDPDRVLGRHQVLVGSTAGVAAFHRVPAAGGGVAARLLDAAGRDHVGLLLASHLEADPDPVAPPAPGGPQWLFCVENQALVLWASAHRVASPVVEATTTAGRLLAAAAARAGWKVAVGGDFEWGGLVAAGVTLAVVEGAVPWRLDAGSYRQAVATGRTSGQRLSSRRVASPWDPDLAAAMAAERLRVTEEDRFEQLTGDLAEGRPRPIG